MDASSNNGVLPSASETDSASEESDSNTQVASNNDNGGHSSASEEARSNTQVLSNQSLLQTPIRTKEQLEQLDHLHETGQNLDGYCSMGDIEIHGLEGHEGNELPDDDFNSDIPGLAEDMSEYSRALGSQESHVGGLIPSASEEFDSITSNKQRVTLDSRNLIAIFFYDEQILAWEILERGLKFKLKIEMRWEHVVGMRASLGKNEPGILEVEISQPPLFFESRDPHPTKPADWASIPDFTDAQATLLRRHHLQFAPGVLDQPFEKLLSCEPRFSHMVQLQSNRTMPHTVPEEAVTEEILDLNLPLSGEEEAINDQGNPPPEGEAVIEEIPDLNLPLSGTPEGEAVIEGIPDLNLPLSGEEEAINDQGNPPPEGTI